MTPTSQFSVNTAVYSVQATNGFYVSGKNISIYSIDSDINNKVYIGNKYGQTTDAISLDAPVGGISLKGVLTLTPPAEPSAILTESMKIRKLFLTGVPWESDKATYYDGVRVYNIWRSAGDDFETWREDEAEDGGWNRCKMVDQYFRDHDYSRRYWSNDGSRGYLEQFEDDVDEIVNPPQYDDIYELNPTATTHTMYTLEDTGNYVGTSNMKIKNIPQNPDAGLKVLKYNVNTGEVFYE
jgi:hypothetical protein